MGKLTTRRIIFEAACAAAVLLFSIGGLSMNQETAHPDGSRRSQHAVPDDDRYKSPIQLAISKDGARLFVACENSDEVLAIDTLQRKVTGGVKVGKHPFGLALDPDGKRLYVGSRWDDTISVIDVESMKILKTAAVGINPHQLKIDPEGKHIYVTNFGSDTISILKTDDFSEVKVFEAGRQPFGIAASPDGRYMYVSSQLSSPVPFRTPPVLELTVLEMKNQWVAGRRNLVSTVIGQDLAVSPDNRFIAVALELPKNLVPETQIYQGWMVTHGFAIIEAGPNGKVAYFLLDDANLYYADP